MWVFRFGGFRGCCIFSGKCHVSLSSDPTFDTYIGSNAGSDDNDIRRVHTLIPRMLSNAGLDDSDIHQMHTLKAYVEYGIHTPIANTGSYTCVLGTSGTWQSLPASRIFLFSFLFFESEESKVICPELTLSSRLVKWWYQNKWWCQNKSWYGVATISRLLQIIGLFCRIQSLL